MTVTPRAVGHAVLGAVRNVLPRRAAYADVPRTWRADLVAGLTVGVVALPLALGFGIATGLGGSRARHRDRGGRRRRRVRRLERAGVRAHRR